MSCGKQAINGIAGTTTKLIMNMDFRAIMVIETPSTPEINNFILSPDVQVFPDGQALGVMDGGFACMSTDPWERTSLHHV